MIKFHYQGLSRVISGGQTGSDHEDTIDEILDIKLDPENAPPVDGVKVLYDGPLGNLSIPLTMAASVALGTGTKWCTSANKDNQYYKYARSGPLYMWKDKSGEKYQFHFESMQFMDSRNNKINRSVFSHFRSKHPVLKKLFAGAEKKMDAWLLIDYIHRALDNQRLPEAEATIAKLPFTALVYARDVLKARWPEAEATILKKKDFESIISYSTFVIKGRWPEAEALLLKMPEEAYMYADQVIHGRWSEAEPIIMTSAEAIVLYARWVLKGRWIKAEQALLNHNNPKYIEQYQTVFKVTTAEMLEHK